MTSRPKITLVTPSLNQGAFVERTVRSVLEQEGDFDLEYLVYDAGSTDGTLDVLRRYEGRLRLVVEPDGGQSSAVNKGLRAATGGRGEGRFAGGITGARSKAAVSNSHWSPRSRLACRA